MCREIRCSANILRGSPKNFPDLTQIFDLDDTSTITMRNADTNYLDLTRANAPTSAHRFLEWTKMMVRFSNSNGTSKTIHTLDFAYINGALETADLWNAATKKGMRLTDDYLGHDWTQNEATDAKLTKRWADQIDRTDTNFTTTAKSYALMLTALAQRNLISDGAANDRMMELMDQTSIGLRPHPFREALEGTDATLDAFSSKIGIDQGSPFNHEVANVSRDIPTIRYVTIRLGTDPHTLLGDLILKLDTAMIANQP